MDMRVSEFIIALHQGARREALQNFRAWALAETRKLLPFDSAMWGAGPAGSPSINHVELFNQPREMIDVYLKRFLQHDFLAREVVSNPGRTINLADLMSREAFTKTPIYRGFARHYGLHQVISTALFDAPSALMNFVSFWRSSEERPFTEQERQLKQFLMPHLILTYTNNTFMHMRRACIPQHEAPFVSAISDRKGILNHVEEGFSAQLSQEWPGWQGPALPAELSTTLFRRTKSTYSGKNIAVFATPMNDLMFLQIRRPNRVDRLTRSERVIAGHLAQGKTHKQISELLKVAPSTVRNHMNSLYKKMGASNKAQVVKIYLEDTVS